MKTQNHCTVLISTRNAEQYIEDCIHSAGKQNYPKDKFDIIFLDAESSDKTYEKAKQLESIYPNLKTFRNEKRKYQGENILIGTKMAKEKSIIIHLDGDDKFKHENVLLRINLEYVRHDCWMSFGTYEHMNPYSDVSHHYHDYPLEVKKNKTFRQYKWLASHVRTYRRELFLKIDENDLKDELTGDFVSMAPDMSFQFYLLEMCGIDKSRYIKDILYCYNVGNPSNESKVNQIEIDRIEKQIRARKPYPTIDKLYEDE